MEFVTNEKLTIVGAAGMIGSNILPIFVCMTHTLPVWKVWQKNYTIAVSKA